MIGPGIDYWIKQHQATPVSDENYQGPDYDDSTTFVDIGAADGSKHRGLLVYDKVTGQIQYMDLHAMTQIRVAVQQLISDKQVELDNFQGFDDTCGERCIAESFELAGKLNGATNAKALVDYVWNQVNPGFSEFEYGTTLVGLYNGVGIAAQHLGVTINNLRYVNNGMALLEALNRGEYVIVGVYLLHLLGVESNHFLLLRPPAATEAVHMIDSVQALDRNPDVFPLKLIVESCELLFGDNNDFGVAFSIA